VCTPPEDHRANPFTILHGRRTRWALKVVQYDQTSSLATSMMLCSEARLPFQRPVSFSRTKEVQHVNYIDRSAGSIFARWRGLGILSLARLTRSPDEHVGQLLDDIFAGFVRGFGSETSEPSFRFPDLKS
jgi:hypothetical protein